MKKAPLALALSLAAVLSGVRAAEPATIKLAPMPGIGHLVPCLAEGLGYFQDEGIKVETVNVMNYIPDDFYSCQLLNNGTIDGEICWYQRVVFGIGNGQPTKAVMLFEHSPHMMIMVANRLKDQIHTASDFKGRTVADSAGFSTKRYLTDYILSRAGLSPSDYTPAPLELSQKLPLLTAALKNDKVDIVSSMEPLTSGVVATGLTTPLFDLTTEEGTRKALGDIWPARCLYLSPAFMRDHPDQAQHLVNALVRAMRYINTHSAEDIVAHLAPDYFAPDINNDFWADYKKGKLDEIRNDLPTFTNGDYSMPPSAAKLACHVLFQTQFDHSDEGTYRHTAATSGTVVPEETYDNSFVQKAMEQYPR